MKEMAYISPTGYKTWKQDKQEFYLQYLSDNRPPRSPQTQPMSVGSSFDAYVKSFLHEGLFGKGCDPKYGFDALFESQVEPHNRDWAKEHGLYVFNQYKAAGCLTDLMTELQSADGTPRFEFEVRGAVHGYRVGNKTKIDEVVLLGKPDVTYTNAQGQHVILDFKVNGYCSDYPPSPMAGYLRLRSAGKTNHGMHKKCHPMMVNGMMMNIGCHLEDVNQEWAAQLAIYAWLCGEPIGSKVVTGIDQVCCDKTKGALPQIRIAEHRCTVSEKFQNETFTELVQIWEIAKSGWIFRDMPEADSRERQALLDRQFEALQGTGGIDDSWFAAACRG